MKTLKQKAIEIIENAVIAEGILASTENIDNYKSVWSRDAAMAGIIGLLYANPVVIEGAKSTILTLAKHQSKTGQIPSNVKFDNQKEKVSYGSLAGRVDATTWWIIVTTIYLKITNDKLLKEQLKHNIQAAIQCLKSWEYNNKNLLYVPLGGNWADEYVSSGYTLYDNALYCWAMKLAGNLYQNAEWKAQSAQTQNTIIKNFNFTENYQECYHPQAMKKANDTRYMFSSLLPNGYDMRFDLAGNSLALLLRLNTKCNDLATFLLFLAKEYKTTLFPVFYPIIKPEDDDWKLLSENFSYHFKNNPHHFHNGGSWMIFLGWLSVAMLANEKENYFSTLTHQILSDVEKKLLALEEKDQFCEYFDTKNYLPCGTRNLCFSAIGYLLMQLNENQMEILKQLL